MQSWNETNLCNEKNEHKSSVCLSGKGKEELDNLSKKDNKSTTIGERHHDTRSLSLSLFLSLTHTNTHKGAK
jgi:hypothetical protein